MKSTETIQLPKAFFRTPEGMKCLDVFEAWQAENPDALEADQRLARLENITAKVANTGIGNYVIQAVYAAGEEGIERAALLTITNKLAAPKRFDADGLRGYLSMQGLKSDGKPNAPLYEEDAVVFLTEQGKTKIEKAQKGGLIEDAHKALLVLGYKKKSALAFIELVLEADPKLSSVEDIVKAVTKKYKTL